ncbi:T-lymphoma invasion and metastasis-inducing protein 2-like [Xiphophorus maculatus]|uniref:T-lymphoma invasion and metastasis-inducing protein 2-like n=1 Tax=Xiphophorus maculatus TaxID=8083 RepID=M4A6A0_XIPMA|nr:T-lymphoma invasion and metastasis-inducing protein 2-like [Xiphophorus maculatus]XP_023203753.1 T-lymphoma invasion and metastasis-inducing protein 2-like [Xiphophorus maculatus]XP_023203754.1 T-lymphoma invasion and metastasis-inducing protein 2-like [Xiphophorus maculatus]XP_023203756.1 T-lymphoma invasion and metastasis-inducing protein 2-like [Xiphophorus maculatus]
MGNTDSHSSFSSPVKPCGSLRFSTKKEEVTSARSWWRSSQSRGQGHQGQQASWQYESAPRGGAKQSVGCPQRFNQGERTQDGRRSPFGFQGPNGDQASLQCGGSPKVLLSKDGSMRVEFTNARVVPVEPQGPPPSNLHPESSHRTSKGSSLSSEGSWYDSPWGAAGELTDSVFVCGQSVDTSSGYNTCSSTQVEDVSPGFSSALLFPPAEGAKGHNSCSSGRTEDSGIGDSVILQPDLHDLNLASPSDFHSRQNALPAFPTSADSFLQQQLLPAMDNVIQEEAPSVGGIEPRYFSHTLPNRKAEPVSAAFSGNNRKDFLKSRIRQLSDWTGSLSRKKRRIQEPHSSDSSGVFINSLNAGAPWPSNPLLQLSQNQFLPADWDFSRSLDQNQSSDAQRQNVYRSFMRELETGCGGAADRIEPSEDDDDAEEEMEEEAGGGDLDGLLEADQGAVRRAGWLYFKSLISVSKDRKLELVARRKWRRYWVTLKGCSLLFYATFGRSSGAEQDLSPRYALLADDSIVQAVPEHPRREHVFCLSNSHGDVYMFQATNQTDLENWVTAIHSASATLLARRQGKEDTLRLLRCQSRSLLHKIDMDGKMKKMAELQLSIIKDQKNRRAVESQIQQWEQNLEKLNLDLFRLRCYQSSLQGSELPNPKSLLAVASRPSKASLGRLGVFSVSSFHALVCSREDGTLRRRCRSVSGGRRRGLPSSLKVLPKPIQDGKLSDHQVLHRHVSAPSAQSVPAVCWSETVTCVSKQSEVLPSAGHVAELQLSEESPPSAAGVFSLNVCRPNTEQDFGFAVTGHVDGAGKSHVFVSDVDPMGLSARGGLLAGDEVLAVNGSAVSGLDLDHLQTLFRHQSLRLLLRRDELPDAEEPTIAWPDPADLWVKQSDLHTWTSDAAPPAGSDPSMPLKQESPEQNTDRVFSLYQTFPESKTSDIDVPRNPYVREGSLHPPSPAHLSVCQRLRKVIQELVDTEKSYVKDLVCLFEIYLTPLQNETFLSKDEMEALFGSLPEMLDFQRVFLQTLEERIASCPDFSSLETPEQFKMLLFSLGGSFLYYADHFKLYSGFCANHIKVQKVLERAKTDATFKHFLETRNPTNQHSSSLESYLIKPVQRVLKYPLLLRELVSLTDAESPEHTHLTEALRAMEKVASHINEMQKIYEDYGCVFDQLVAEQSGADKQVTEISMGEFLVHSPVVWLNPLPCLRRLRKEPQLTLFVFKRAVILVHRENKLKKRMTSSRSADLDPFRFRWLIPVSTLQVRPANIPGSEDPCVWELVHSRSEVEGRPETVFQLCSSDLDAKAALLRALSSLLKDQAASGSLRRTRPSAAERSATWRRRPRPGRSDLQRTAPHPPAERCGALEETCSEPPLPSHAGSSGMRPRLCSLTGELEAQLQRLNFSEDDQGAAQRLDEEKRRTSSLRRGAARDGLDFSSFVGRDFSIQSMTSMINEDCFYDPVLAIQTDDINLLT